mgnify:CR=1 FL=1
MRLCPSISTSFAMSFSVRWNLREKCFRRLWGKTFPGLTRASPQRDFIRAQIPLLFSGAPLRVTQIPPEEIPRSWAYAGSFFRGFPGSKMVRILLLQCPVIAPRLTASTVKNRSSDTRIPVPQIVSRMRRSCGFFAAARKSLRYSALLSSFSSAQYVWRCTFRLFTRIYLSCRHLQHDSFCRFSELSHHHQSAPVCHRSQYRTTVMFHNLSVGSAVLDGYLVSSKVDYGAFIYSFAL